MGFLVRVHALFTGGNDIRISVVQSLCQGEVCYVQEASYSTSWLARLGRYEAVYWDNNVGCLWGRTLTSNLPTCRYLGKK